MSVTPSPIGGFAAQFFDNNGVILSGGKIFTYAAGTTTPQASYTSASGVTPHSNPIILDSAGRVPGGEIWLTDGLVYKFVIETATGILLGTYDNITGVNSNFVNYTIQEEVITATAGQTVFNLSTINYTPGTNSLTVYIDGVNQYVGDSYLETDSNTVTFTSGVHVGGEVKFTTAIQTTTGAVDASIVSFTQAGTGAVAQTVQTKLEQYVSVNDFSGADDNAKWAAAVSAAGTTGSLDTGGAYSLTGVTLAQYSKINGSDTSIARVSGSSPLITIPTNSAGLQTVDYTKLTNIEINSSISGVRTGIGVEIENNAAVVLDTVGVRGATTGFLFDRSQFAGLSYVKAYDCTVGINIRPTLSEGGGNSLTFTHALAIGNDVGVLLDNSGNVFPQHSVVFLNPQILVNKVCGMAVIGASSALRTQVVQYGAAPEANADDTVPGSASITVNGNVIPRCSYYGKWAEISLNSAYIAEYNTCNPMTILVGSTFSLHDVSGYGGPSNVVIQADQDSSVTISGNYGLVGCAQQVQNFSGHLSVVPNNGILQGPERRILNTAVTNEAAAPEVANISDTPGVTAATYGVDAEGRYYEVDFAASAGNADNNVARLTLPGGAAQRIVFRVDIESAADASFLVGIYPNEGNVKLELKAGVPQTLIYWRNNVVNAANLLTIFPTTTNGPTVKLRRAHILTGDLNDGNFCAAVDAICGGAYNPNIAAIVPYGAATTAPSSSAYPTGAIVWNSAPTAGGVSYWQHVGSGTWKAVSLAL